MPDIHYTSDLEDIEPAHLEGFFQGWDSPPSPERHLEVLRGSTHAILAWDDETKRVVGFINALSDGVMMAFIPLLEVLPEYQHHGIGSELVRLMMARLKGQYSIDIVCDSDVVPFYERFRLLEGTALMYRDRAWLRKREGTGGSEAFEL